MKKYNNYITEKLTFKTLKEKLKYIVTQYETKEIYMIEEIYVHVSSNPNIILEPTFDFDKNLDLHEYIENVDDYDMIQYIEYEPYRFDVDDITENIFNRNFSDDDLSDDYDVDELTEIVEEYLLSSDDIYDNINVIDYIDYEQQRLDIENEKELDFEVLISDTKIMFKRKYKDYIQIDENAGYHNESYYAYLLTDDDGLVENTQKLLINNIDRYNVDILSNDNENTISRNIISRNYKLLDKTKKVILIRISNHVQNVNNIDDIVDNSLSIVFNNNLIDCNTQQGYEEGDYSKVDNNEPEEINNNIFEYKYSGKGDKELPIDIINYFLNNI